MKARFLGTVAAFAFIATGLAASAQEGQRQENKGSERAPATAPRGEVDGPKAGGAMQKGAMQNKEGPKAAEGEKREPNGEVPGKEPTKAAEGEKREPNGAVPGKEPTKAAEGEKREPNGAGPGKEAPKAAQSEKRAPNGAAPGKDVPKAAQSEKPEPDGSMRKDATRAETPRGDEPKAAQSEKRGAPDAKRQGQAGQGQNGSTGARGEPRVSGVKISTEHASRIGETLHREARPQRTTFDVRVGVRVPEGFEIRPLPIEIVEIEPEYRGYDYFIDTNDEIVFVSPQTHEIVGTIAYEGRAAAVDSPRAARPCPPED